MFADDEDEDIKILRQNEWFCTEFETDLIKIGKGSFGSVYS